MRRQVSYMESVTRTKPREHHMNMNITKNPKFGFTGPIVPVLIYYLLQWRHNDRDGVSNNQSRGCLLNRLFRRRSKKTS